MQTIDSLCFKNTHLMYYLFSQTAFTRSHANKGNARAQRPSSNVTLCRLPCVPSFSLHSKEGTRSIARKIGPQRLETYTAHSDQSHTGHGDAHEASDGSPRAEHTNWVAGSA